MLRQVSWSLPSPSLCSFSLSWAARRGKKRKLDFSALVSKHLKRRGKKKADFIECRLTNFQKGTYLLRRLFPSCSVIDVLFYFWSAGSKDTTLCHWFWKCLMRSSLNQDRPSTGTYPLLKIQLPLVTRAQLSVELESMGIFRALFYVPVPPDTLYCCVPTHRSGDSILLGLGFLDYSLLMQ